MKAIALSSGTAATKKASPLWWMFSLGLHAILLGVLFFLFPSKEFVKPAARATSQRPLVNQKTLEAITRRLGQKQSAELASKLRGVAAITAGIQSDRGTSLKNETGFSFAVNLMPLKSDKVPAPSGPPPVMARGVLIQRHGPSISIVLLKICADPLFHFRHKIGKYEQTVILPCGKITCTWV